MKRSAIIIGVDKTGGMPTLKDAAKGARRFEAWAGRQKLDKFASIHVFTDENGGVVDVNPIFDTIAKIVEDGTTEQLVIYFAGHGVNIGYSEYWLLSRAPKDPQAAVNVRGSAWQAAYSGIPHTVFISDACRTAAEGGTMQRIIGSVIFPNEGGGGLESAVDTFYACTLGRPALEVRDPQVASSQFTALYTTAFLDGLEGKGHNLPEKSVEEGKSIAYVRPRPLKVSLTAEVPKRLADLKLQTSAIQVPDAHIASDGSAWLARFIEEDAVQLESAVPPVVAEFRPTAETTSATLLKSVIDLGAEGLKLASVKTRSIGGPKETDKVTGSIDALFALAQKAAEPFGASLQETQCGFKIRGAKFASVLCRRADVEGFAPGSEVVRMFNVHGRGASVLLGFDNGTAALLPVLPEFQAALTVEDGELVDVSYEPVSDSGRWFEYKERADDIRALRAVAASATRSGVFRIDGENSLKVAQRMQYLKGVDPSLAIYAAYAYQDLQRRDLIQEMSGFMLEDLGARFFDVALLTRDLLGIAMSAGEMKERGVLAPFPLLAQGWSLLAAQRISLPESLKNLQQTLVPSVWSLFDKEGLRKIQNAIQQSDIL